MTGNIKKQDYKSLLGNISTLIEEARRKAVKQVNTIIVFLMRKFYLTYPSQKFQTVSGKFKNEQILSWSHYCELITLNDNLARSFYEIESIKYKLYLPTRRELEAEIRKESTRLSPVNHGDTQHNYRK